MGVVDRFLNSMKFNDDYDDYDDYEEEEDEVVEPRRSRFRSSVLQDEEETVRPQRGKITPMPKKRGGSFSQGMGVCVVKPTSVEDGGVIVDTLLDNRTVVINLEGIPTDTAQRIMDITFGANMALDGHFQQISRNIFIITPKSVDISGDFTGALGGQMDMFGIAK